MRFGTRPRSGSRCVEIHLVGRRDLTNAQWAKPKLVLPVGKKPGRGPVHTKRQLMDGIRRRTRACVPWRDLRERYGPLETVYSRPPRSRTGIPPPCRHWAAAGHGASPLPGWPGLSGAGTCAAPQSEAPATQAYLARK
ncbi:transposase [Streptomyces sp. NPDC097727]|uniref:transposase n=1 Tax=Streptomyces sp. NPDC097727 TaxID=3366092 RepID=UPI00382E9E15